MFVWCWRIPLVAYHCWVEIWPCDGPPYSMDLQPNSAGGSGSSVNPAARGRGVIGPNSTDLSDSRIWQDQKGLVHGPRPRTGQPIGNEPRNTLPEPDAARGDEPKPDEEGVKLKLTWGSSDDLPTICANEFVISHFGPQFYLVFGELGPPFGADGKTPSEVTIRPVVKIAVAPDAMERMAEAIAKNVERAKAVRGKADDSSTAADERLR